MAVALALVAVMVGQNESPAEATTFNPSHTVSVSDPTPGANADIIINFSLSPPDAFPNTTTDSSTQFIPGQWGIHTDAPLGAIGGTFNALSTIGILSSLPCVFPTPVPFTMFNATTDTSVLTSTLDVGKGQGFGGADAEPGGLGYSGQFIADPDSPEGLRGGVTRYPDFLLEMFPDAGEPLTRLWGGQPVLIALVSLNLVTFDKGALPGFPASMGYPTVTVLLDPVAKPELFQNAVTNVTCTPLALTNTTFGVTQDNPDTAADEGGFPALTNPKAEKDHTFTLVTQSDYDADDDGIENWLDSCDLTPDTPAGVDGRNLFGGPGDTDRDGLDEACDPDPLTRSPIFPGVFLPDEDFDAYPNAADNCPLDQNGWATFLGLGDAPTGFPNEFFGWALVDNPVGPDEQADSDFDRIGDACDSNPFSPDGHFHALRLEREVIIDRHGVKLDDLSGPESVASGGSANYSVAVENKESAAADDFGVGLRVVEGCASVSGPSTVHVNADGTANVNYTVDWSGCADGTYTVQADACHEGDLGAGLFGVGDCPGAGDGEVDSNPLDDAPRSISVTVGSP